MGDISSILLWLALGAFFAWLILRNRRPNEEGRKTQELLRQLFSRLHKLEDAVGEFRKLDASRRDELEDRVASLEQQINRVKATTPVGEPPIVEPAAGADAQAVPAPGPVESPSLLEKSAPARTPEPSRQQVAFTPAELPASGPATPPPPAAPPADVSARPEPQPISSDVPQSRLFPAKSLRSAVDVEEMLGTNWLNKLGVTILVLGVAFFLAYELRTMGPEGKVLVGYLVAATMLGSGIVLERRDRYRILARAGIGGGWALLYFTTYAMYHVQAARVLSSQGLDLVLMLAVATAMVAHTLHYRSQVVTALAFLLAFSTVTISRVDVYSLSASAILAVALVVVVLRMSWFEMEVFGILATYLNHYLWLRPIIEPMGKHHHPFSGASASTGLLLLYWAVFRASYIFRRPAQAQQERASTVAALLNTGFLLWVMGYQALHPELAFQFFLGVGAAEFVLAQLPITRRRRTAFVILTVVGATLLVAAFPYKYSGSNLSLWWIAQAEALFLGGVLTGEIVFRRLGLLAGLIVAGQMLSMDVASVYGMRMDDARVVSEPRLALIFVVTALIFYANVHWLPRRRPELVEGRFDSLCLRRFSYAGFVLAFAAVWLLWPTAWTAVGWSALALVLGIAGQRLRLKELSVQANVVAVTTVIRVLTTNLELKESYHHLTLRLVTVSIVVAVLYLFSHWTGLPELVKTRRIPTAYTWAASALVATLAWYELRPVSVAVAWTLIGMTLFELGFARRSASWRFQGYVALGFAFLRLFYVNLNATGELGQISPRVYTVVPVALAFYYLYWRLSDSADEFLERDRHVHAAGVSCFLGLLTVAALMRFEVDSDWVVVAWAALALLLIAIAWRTGRRIFLHHSAFLAFAVLFRTIAHNFYERSYFPAPFWHGRLVCVGLTVALLFLTLPFAFRLRSANETTAPEGPPSLPRTLEIVSRRPEQLFYFTAFLLLTWLLAIEMRQGMVTLSWGVEAVVVFVVALWIGERSYRLSGLGLLLLCVAKIVVVDVWRLTPRDRYVTFIVLGSALLGVSFLYTRFRGTLRQYL